MEIEAEDFRVRTKLQEVLDDGDLVVLQPTVKGVPVRTRQDEPARFTFCRPDGVYLFEALLLSTFVKANLLLCRCRPVSEISKIQRREYYRLPITLDVLIESSGEKTAERKCFKCKTIDISENGVQLSCLTGFEKGTVFDMKIKLSRMETIEVTGEVLSCEPPLNRNEPYRMVLVFGENAVRIKARLRRYIFSQQIINRKKEMNRLI